MSDRPVFAFDIDHTTLDADGRVYPGAIETLNELRRRRWWLVVFTLRENAAGVAKELTAKGVPFDTINENPPGIKNRSRKIYYDVLLDNRNITFNGSWAGVLEEAERRRQFGNFDIAPAFLVKKQIGDHVETVCAAFLSKDGRLDLVFPCAKIERDEFLSDLGLSEKDLTNAELVKARLSDLNGSILWSEPGPGLRP